MATFTPEEIEFIKTRGNDYCRRVWLGLYEGESVNFTDEQSVKDFMSDKYEKKRYYIDMPAGSATVNGASSGKNRVKSKGGSVASSAPLISISPQSMKNPANNNSLVNSAKVVNSLASVGEERHRVARPVVSTQPQPLPRNNLNMVPAPVTQPPVPE